MVRIIVPMLLLAMPLAAQQPAKQPAKQPAQPSARIQLGTRVVPVTVTVGDPFAVVLRLRVPSGATVQFPSPPDTSGPVQALDPVSVRDTVIGAVTEYVATYRLAAWDVGALPINLADLLVRQAGTERKISLATLGVVVRSVLPADSAQRVPKPARPPLDVPVSNWWKWLAAAIAALIVAILFWWWRRWRNRPRPTIVVDPLRLAGEEFARVEALGLLEAGERGRYVALMVDVVRDYLARRVGTPASLTSSELLAVLRRKGVVPLDRLAPLLTEADLVKFARYQVGAERAKHFAAEARAIVQQADDATMPPPVAEQSSAKRRVA